MPFVPAQQDSLAYDRLKKRQIVVWVFLFCIGFSVVSVSLYVGYQFTKQNGSSGISQSAVMVPVVSDSGRAKTAEARDARHLLYGEFSPSDKRYRIYKVYYGQFFKGEFFSFPWRDAASLPEITMYGERLAVFTDRENGFLINRDGKISGNGIFVPPSNAFTVSPDGKRMLYFKYLSSLGNTSLAVRDVENDSDVFTWPMSSSASALCSFSGWSGDGTKAYCTARAGGTATVKSFDAYRYTSAVAASLAKASSVRYYPDRALALFVQPHAVIAISTTTKERKELVVLEDGETAEDAMLSPNGATVLYTTRPRDAASSMRTLYVVQADGSGARKVVAEDGLRLISFAPDGAAALVARLEKGSVRVERYGMVDMQSGAIKELYVSDAPSPGTQFIGWFED